MGADIEAKNTEGWTPLHWAVSGKSLECVRMLLQAGANPNSRSPAFSTPVWLVFRPWFPGCRGYLANKPANALRTQIVSELADAGEVYDIKNCQGVNFLGWAINLGDVDVVRYLIQLGARMDVASRAKTFFTKQP